MNKNKTKKIVSFLPSATEILYELGATTQVVGVTHECNYPKEAKSKPRVINAAFDASNMSSKEIDDKIIELFSNGKDIYIINDRILKELRPDIIIAQGICEVCSPFTKEIKRSISILGYNPEIVVLDPHNISDILTNISQIAKNVGKIKEGQNLVGTLEYKINRIKKITELKNAENLSRILCLEWLDPFFTAGHWVPEMVEIAGGINGLSKPKEQSRRTSIEEIKKFDPDKIILMPCGFNIDRTIKEYKNNISLNENQEWNNLRAIKNNELYVVDAGSYFSKPGPRTITGIEILGKIISTNEFKHITIPENSYSKLITNDLTNK
ncbi:MAG: uptake transporter, putative heme-binding protein [Nitrososphaeraceae archaeon]|nr:uptake transporter, putative heme-binding protein [Nitrososphaeraceae archaeon]